MKTSEILKLVRQVPYFTKQNLGLALGKEKESLSYWVQKLLKEGELVALKKGFYISTQYRDFTAQKPGEQEQYWEYLANMLCEPSYVSLEYVLSKQNIIPEAAFAVTSVTTKTSRAYQSAGRVFQYRTLKANFFFGFAKTHFRGMQVLVADAGKALFDFLYLKTFPHASNMEDYLFRSGRVNWDALTPQNKKNFLTAVSTSNSGKMNRILRVLQKKNII